MQILYSLVVWFDTELALVLTLKGRLSFQQTLRGQKGNFRNMQSKLWFCTVFGKLRTGAKFGPFV